MIQAPHVAGPVRSPEPGPDVEAETPRGFEALLADAVGDERPSEPAAHGVVSIGPRSGGAEGESPGESGRLAEAAIADRAFAALDADDLHAGARGPVADSLARVDAAAREAWEALGRGPIPGRASNPAVGPAGDGEALPPAARAGAAPVAVAEAGLPAPGAVAVATAHAAAAARSAAGSQVVEVRADAPTHPGAELPVSDPSAEAGDSLVRSTGPATAHRGGRAGANGAPPLAPEANAASPGPGVVDEAVAREVAPTARSGEREATSEPRRTLAAPAATPNSDAVSPRSPLQVDPRAEAVRADAGDAAGDDADFDEREPDRSNPPLPPVPTAAPPPAALDRAAPPTLPVAADLTAEVDRTPATREPAAAPRPVPVANLPERIEGLAGAGGGSARIRLDPPNLGEIQLEVRVRGDAVAVRVVAREEAARTALDKGRGRLVDGLAARSLRMERLDVVGSASSDPELSDGATDPRSGDGHAADRDAFPGTRESFAQSLRAQVRRSAARVDGQPMPGALASGERVDVRI